MDPDVAHDAAFTDGRAHDLIRNFQKEVVSPCVDLRLLKTKAEKRTRFYTAKVGRRCWTAVVHWCMAKKLITIDEAVALTVFAQHTPGVAVNEYSLLPPRSLPPSLRDKYFAGYEALVVSQAAGKVMRNAKSIELYEASLWSALPRITLIVWTPSPHHHSSVWSVLCQQRAVDQGCRGGCLLRSRRGRKIPCGWKLATVLVGDGCHVHALDLRPSHQRPTE